MLSHSYAHMGAYAFALSLTRGLRVEADLRLCSFLPVIYHVADQVLSLPAFLAGGSLVIGRKPVPQEMAAAVAREKVTALWGGSPQLVKAFAGAVAADPGLAPNSGVDGSALGVLVYGGGAVEPAVLESLKQRCAEDFLLVGIFGQTQALPCPRVWPDLGPGQDLLHEPGVPGEAVYRSPAVASGYYKDQAATEQAFRHGWFHSGDSCVVDDDGLRIMVDRYKDIIKSGGENVSSLRVEAVLHQHPDVAKSAVVGLPHDRWGEAVTAIVVCEPGRQPDAAELITFCRERLAGFESPKAILFAAALPETGGGKVLKYKLRQQLAGHYANV